MNRIIPECPGAERGTVGLPAEDPDLARQAHHGRFDVQVGQVDWLGLVAVPVVQVVRVGRVRGHVGVRLLLLRVVFLLLRDKRSISVGELFKVIHHEFMIHEEEIIPDWGFHVLVIWPFQPLPFLNLPPPSQLFHQMKLDRQLRPSDLRQLEGLRGPPPPPPPLPHLRRVPRPQACYLRAALSWATPPPVACRWANPSCR